MSGAQFLTCTESPVVRQALLKKVPFALAESLQSLNLEDSQLNDEKFIRTLIGSLASSTSVTELNLAKNGFGAVGVEVLATYLTETSMGGDGFRRIAECLEKNRSITDLSLAGNSWTFTRILRDDKGPKQLGAVITKSPSIRTLNLRGTSIALGLGEEWASALKKNDSITDLNFAGCFGADEYRSIDDALRINRNINILNLSSNSIGVKGAKFLAETLKSNSSLTELTLDDNGFGAEGTKLIADALQANSCLLSLSLRQNSMGKAGAQALAQSFQINRTLTVLNLDGNKLGDDGIALLADALKIHSTLTHLDLSRNDITSMGLFFLNGMLKINSSLKALILNSNTLKADAVKELCECLKTNSGLEHISLGDTGLGKDGAASLGLALRTNRKLKRLSLLQNKLELEGFLELADAMSVNVGLETLDLPHEEEFAKPFLYRLDDSIKLNKWVVSISWKPPQNNCFQVFIGRPCLTSAQVAQSLRSEVNLFVAPTLTCLDLSLHGLVPHELKNLVAYLKTSDSISSLHLGDNDLKSDFAQRGKYLAKTRSVVGITRPKDNIFDLDTVRAIASYLQSNKALLDLSLGKLNLGVNAMRELCFGLAANSSVQNLTLSRNPIGPEGAQVLGDLLRLNKTIRRLFIEGCNIGQDGMKHIATALGLTKSIQVLGIGDNNLGETGMIYLAEAVQAVGSLRELILDHTSLTVGGLAKLTASLTANANVAKLSLQGCRMTPDEFNLLCEFLKSNKTLKALLLICNPLSPPMVKSLAQCITTNAFLTELNLSETKLGPEGCKILATALRTNHKLTTLVMRENEIGNEGFRTLLQALVLHASLASLDLGENNVAGTAPMQDLADYLSVNSGLQKLFLDGNPMKYDSMRALGEALKLTKSIAEIYVGDRATTADEAKLVIECLQVNTSLTMIALPGKVLVDSKSILSHALVEAKKLNSPSIVDYHVGTTAVWIDRAATTATPATAPSGRASLIMSSPTNATSAAPASPIKKKKRSRPKTSSSLTPVAMQTLNQQNSTVHVIFGAEKKRLMLNSNSVADLCADLFAKLKLPGDIEDLKAFVEYEDPTFKDHFLPISQLTEHLDKIPAALCVRVLVAPDPAVLASLPLARSSVMIGNRVSQMLMYQEAALATVEEIREEDLKVEKVIGEGASGRVYLAKFRGDDVAVKKLRSDGSITPLIRNEIIKELTLLRHPRIVLLMGAITKLVEPCIVMEYLALGSLNEVMYKRNIHLTMDQIKSIAIDIAKGLVYLHSLTPPIIHGDMKPENIYIGKNFEAKIGDFGLASAKIIDLAQNPNGPSGTLLYMAPELFKQGSHRPSVKTDVYATAMTIYEMFIREKPFGSQSRELFFEKILASGQAKLDLEMRGQGKVAIPPQIQTLIRQCTALDPMQRPTASTLLDQLVAAQWS